MVQQDDGTGSAALAACSFTQIRREIDRQAGRRAETDRQRQRQKRTDRQTDRQWEKERKRDR